MQPFRVHGPFSPRHSPYSFSQIRTSPVKPMKNMAAPTTVFHSFVLLFISAKLSLNLRRYTGDRKDGAVGAEGHGDRQPLHRAGLHHSSPQHGGGKHTARNTTQA